MATSTMVRERLRRWLCFASACWMPIGACSGKDDAAAENTASGTDSSLTASSAATSSAGTASVTTGAASTTQAATSGAQTATTTSTATNTTSLPTTTSGTTTTTTTTSTATATTTGAGGASATTEAVSSETSAGGTGGQGTTSGTDLLSFASELDGLFIDKPCQEPTPTPLPDEATCDHAGGMQHVEEATTFGGESSTTYLLTLRVRGIWEPTFISGGEAPDPELPFKIGGQVAEGNAIDYQQFYITVSDPAQTYWLNDYQYTAHDIYKEDYEITIPVVGGASVTVVVNDGNEREISNYPEEIFEDMPPYDQEPTKGQLLQLEVVSVSEE